MSKLYNVMTQNETECFVIDEGVTKYQAEYLAHWHRETLGKAHHWKEPMNLGKITGDPVGFDLETIARNEFEEKRANHDARAKWVDRAATKRVVAIGDESGVTKSVIDWSHRHPVLEYSPLPATKADNAEMLSSCGAI